MIITLSKKYENLTVLILLMFGVYLAISSYLTYGDFVQALGSLFFILIIIFFVRAIIRRKK